MVETVLDYLEGWLAENIVSALEREGDAVTRLQRMCDRLDELYEGGQQPCLFAILLLGSARDVFHAKVKALFQAWIEAISQVLIEAGMDGELARQRGEDGAIAIQGSLVLSLGLDDPTPFKRAIQTLPHTLVRSRKD